MSKQLYRVLDKPWMFRLARSVLAPGTEAGLPRIIEHLFSQLPLAKRLLDVGCGPSSWLFRFGMCPMGVDLTYPYVLEYARRGAPAVVASAQALPFPAQSFDGVWSIGLLHHLPTTVASEAIHEMIRVCQLGGYVAILDAVSPHTTRQRPIAALLRRLDRGQFMRRQGELEALLPHRERWSVQRRTFSVNGLEALNCWLIKQ